MNKRNLFITATLLVLIIGVGACKKESSSNADSPKVSDACQLISVSEAEAISGESYTSTETTETVSVGQKICGYNTSDNGLFQISLTQTLAITNSGIKTAKGFYDSMKTNFPSHKMITGVGDEAFIDATNGFIHILYINDYYISITIMQSGSPLSSNRWTAIQKEEKKKAAGLKAIERLKKILGN